MKGLHRKVWVMMLTLALAISQLLPTGLFTITAFADNIMEIEEMKETAPAEEKKAEEKKEEAAPVEEKKEEIVPAEETKTKAAPVEEKKAELPSDEKKLEEKTDAAELKEYKEAVELEQIKDDSKLEELKADVIPEYIKADAVAEEPKADEKAEEVKADVTTKEKMADKQKEEIKEEEKSEEKEVARDLYFFRKDNTMFSVDPVAYYDYNGSSQTLYPTFNNVNNSGVIDSQGRWIIHLKKLGDVRSQTYYLTPKYVGVTSQTNAGTYSVGAVIEAAKVEDAYGRDVTNRVNANWGNNDYYTFGVVSYQGIIRPKNISVRLNDVTKVYGEKDPDVSTWATLTGGSLASGDSLTKILNLQRKKGEDVGVYPFAVSVSSQGGGESSARKVAARSGAMSKEMVSDKKKVEETQMATKVGNYNISFEDNEGTLTITPAPLTITAIDNGKLYGTRDPKLAVSIEGLVNDESIPDGFYKHWRTPGEKIGKYPINLSISKDAAPAAADNEEYYEAEKEELEKDELKEEMIVVKEEWAIAKEDYAETWKNVCKSSADRAEERSLPQEAVRRSEERIDMSEWLIEKPISEVIPEYPGTIIVADDPADTSNFKASNYDITLIPGVFTITGNGKPETVVPVIVNDDDDSDDNDPVDVIDDDEEDDDDAVPAVPVVSRPAAPVRSNTPAPRYTNPAPAAVTDDIEVAEVNDAATPAAAPDAAPEAPAAATIADPAVPLTGGNGAWALVNLICTILAGLGAIIAVFRRKEDEDDEENAYKEEDDDDNRGRKMFAAKTAGILTAIAAVITFILTEDMRLPMIMIDKWTVLMIIMLAVQIVAAVLNKKAAEAEEEDEEATTSEAN